MWKLVKLLWSLSNRALEIALIIAVGALVVSVVWGVMTRWSGDIVASYSDGSVEGIWAWLPAGQAQWTEELAKFLLVWVSLLGGAVAFGRKSHLGVDYFVGKLNGEANQWSRMVVHAVVMFFAIAVLMVGGFRVVLNALVMEQTTPVLGWKMGLVYLALPISGLYVARYTLQGMMETLTEIRAGDTVDNAAIADGKISANQEGV